MSSSDAGSTLLQTHGVSKHFQNRPGLREHRDVPAVDNVSFSLARGQALGMVGESGSGKSTLARMIVGLLQPSAGEISIEGQPVQALRGRKRRELWRHVQMIFQDPYSCLNPTMTIRDILAEPLRNFGIARGAQAEALILSTLESCGLARSVLTRYPHEFSGGQRQRIGIARALIPRPTFIVADEPVSALDVSVQAQILNLLLDLKSAYGLTYLFIAHDLAVVRYIADSVAVMYRGRLVELGTTRQVYTEPQHPYTRALLQSIPFTDPALEVQRRARGKLAAHGGHSV